MKITRFFAIVLICVLIFCGCSADDTQSATNDNSKFLFGMDPDMNSAEVSATAVSSDSLMENAIGNIHNVPSFGVGMFLSMDDRETFSPLIYNGSDFEFFYQVTAGIKPIELDIGFTLNGIYQQFKIEDDGKISDYDIKYLITVPAGATKIYKIFLKPNVGKSGEVLTLYNASIVNPNEMVREKNGSYALFQVGLVAGLPFPFTMESDSDQTASVCNNFSGMEIVPYDKKIKKMFTEFDETGAVCQQLIYHDLDTEVYYDSYKTILATEHIEATRSSEFPITLVLGGGKWGTTQRVSVYVNGEIMPVFDGEYYADVPIEKNKQTNLNIKLDTTDLDEWSNIYFLACTISEAENAQSDEFVQSRIYSVRIS